MYGGFEYGGNALGTGTGWGSFGDVNEFLNQWRRTVYPDWFPKPSLSRAIMSGSSWIGEIYYDPVHWLQTIYPDFLLRKPTLPVAIVSGSSWIGIIIPPTGGDILMIVIMLNNPVPGAVQ